MHGDAVHPSFSGRGVRGGERCCDCVHGRAINTTKNFKIIAVAGKAAELICMPSSEHTHGVI